MVVKGHVAGKLLLLLEPVDKFPSPNDATPAPLFIEKLSNNGESSCFLVCCRRSNF
jgi:hypothetical protein